MSTDGAVDLSSLRMLRQLQRPGAPDAVGRIIDRFLEESPQRISTVHAAVDADNARLLEQAAHALKGIAGTVGANHMRDIAATLEQLGRSGSTNGAAELTHQLEAALDYARPLFESVRAPDADDAHA